MGYVGAPQLETVLGSNAQKNGLGSGTMASGFPCEFYSGG